MGATTASNGNTFHEPCNRIGARLTRPTAEQRSELGSLHIESPRDGQLVSTGLPRSVATGERRSAVASDPLLAAQDVFSARNLLNTNWSIPPFR